MNYQNPYAPYPYPWMGVTPSPQYAQPQTSAYQTMSQSQQPPQQQSTGAAPLTGCNEAHRLNSGVVTVRQGCFRVSFSGNVTGTAAGPVQLAIALDGSPLNETTMVNSIGTAGDLENASAQTAFRSCPGCCSRLTVQNTGTVPVIIGANPSLTVTRVG